MRPLRSFLVAISASFFDSRLAHPLSTSACARLVASVGIVGKMGSEPRFDIADTVQHGGMVHAHPRVPRAASRRSPIGKRARAYAKHSRRFAIGYCELPIGQDALVAFLNFHVFRHENPPSVRCVENRNALPSWEGAPIGRDTRVRAPQHARPVVPRAGLKRPFDPALPAWEMRRTRRGEALFPRAFLLRGHGRPHSHLGMALPLHAVGRKRPT